MNHPYGSNGVAYLDVNAWRNAGSRCILRTIKCCNWELSCWERDWSGWWSRIHTWCRVLGTELLNFVREKIVGESFAFWERLARMVFIAKGLQHMVCCIAASQWLYKTCYRYFAATSAVQITKDWNVFEGWGVALSWNRWFCYYRVHCFYVTTIIAGWTF